MRIVARSVAIALVSALALGGLVAPAAAQNITGFFSRFLPGDDPTKPPPPPVQGPQLAQKPTPLPAMPDDPTDASPFSTHRGGLIDAFRGAPVAGCQGTLCNFIGGETAVRPVQPPAPGSAAASASAEAPREAEVTAVRSTAPRVDDRVSPRKERCTAPANDRWRCYR